ncbi:uncharacterized protein LOC144688610 [Cetorhinus maximus]
MTSDSRPRNASPHLTLQSDIDAEEWGSLRTGNWRPIPAPRTHSLSNQARGADSLNLRAAGWQNPTPRIVTTPSHMSETTPVREHTEGNWRPIPAPRTHSLSNQARGADSLNLRAAGWQNPTPRIVTTPSHMSETTPVREHTEGNWRPIPTPQTHSLSNQARGADSLNLRAAGWQNPTPRIVTTPSHMSETTPVREHTEDEQSGTVVLCENVTGPGLVPG